MAFAFEKLIVYQKAVDFADKIASMTENFSRGSVQECVPLLELALRRNLISKDNHKALKSHLEEISKMLSGLINGLKNVKCNAKIEQGSSGTGEQVKEEEYQKADAPLPCGLLLSRSPFPPIIIVLDVILSEHHQMFWGFFPLRQGRITIFLNTT